MGALEIPLIVVAVAKAVKATGKGLNQNAIKVANMLNQGGQKVVKTSKKISSQVSQTMAKIQKSHTTLHKQNIDTIVTKKSDSVKRKILSAKSKTEIVGYLLAESSFAIDDKATSEIKVTAKKLTEAKSLQDAKEIGTQITNTLEESNQRVLVQSLTHHIQNSLTEDLKIPEVRLNDNGNQIIGSNEANDRIIFEVRPLEMGEVSVNIGARYKDGTCKKKIRQLQKSLSRRGVSLAVGSPSDKTMPPKQVSITNARNNLVQKIGYQNDSQKL